MNNLKVALCQSDIIWENAEATLKMLEEPVRAFCKKHKPDLLILPETYSVGFTMNPEVSEYEDGISAQWLRRMASELGAAVTASIPTYDVDKDGTTRRYNRCHFITPDGMEYHYDKRHLFNPSGEGGTYTSGKERCCVEYKGWRIELNICYDLRFPVWSRNEGNRYDVLVNMANWPDVRVSSAQALIRARAIENSCYAVFCNRVGSDVLCEYNGKSTVVDWFGTRICRDSIVKGVRFMTAELDRKALEHYRLRFPASKDADNYKIETQ